MADSMQLAAISVERRGGVAYVTFDNGGTNMLDAVLMGDLFKLTDWLEREDAVQVVVFQSASPTFFLSHADFGLLKSLKDSGVYDQSAARLYGDFLQRLRSMPKVMIAKVAGLARGGGAEFVFAMDMAFADLDKARFALMEIMMGLLPGGGGALYLAEKIGRARALEMCLGGADFDAIEAAQYGMINRALPSEALDAFVNELANRISRFDVAAIAANKKALAFDGDEMARALDRNADLFLVLFQREAFDHYFERYGRLEMGLGSNTHKDWRDWAPLLAE